jgi:hypothetical protein
MSSRYFFLVHFLTQLLHMRICCHHENNRSRDAGVLTSAQPLLTEIKRESSCFFLSVFRNGYIYIYGCAPRNRLNGLKGFYPYAVFNS